MYILTKSKTNKKNNIENRKPVHKNLCLIYHLLPYLVTYLSIVPQTLLTICPQSNNRQILIALFRLLIVWSEIVCYQIITFNQFTLI